MVTIRNGSLAAALLCVSSASFAESELLAHVACKAEIAELGESRGIALSTGQTYVAPPEDDSYRYYLNAIDRSDSERRYRATCLVTPRGEVLEAALESGHWAYTRRHLGDGADNREALAGEDRR